MSDSQPASPALEFLGEFPPVSTAAWEAAIEKELKGSDSEELVWHTDEGVAVRPYYRMDVLAGLEAQTCSQPGEFPFVRGNGAPWEIAQAAAIGGDAIRADLLLEAGADSVQQLGIALAAGVEKLAKLSEARPLDEAAREIQFVFAVASTFFIEIAKLRAARMLWSRAVEQFHPASLECCRMHLHVRTANINKSVCDPDTNMLRATTEAMSAAMGGCDSLSIEPFGFDERLALSIQRVLAEEVHLNAVADPAGGSYYVEALTASVAREAWKLFQRIEAEGGYSQALQSAWLAEAIAGSRAARQSAVSTRRRTLVGVNNYPNRPQKVKATKPTAADAGVFPPFRLAAPYEALQERVARQAAQSGRTPRILLLKHGDLKMRTARASFAFNFFGCAGFDIAESGSFTPTDADMIVLCSSDAEYLPLATEVCPAVPVPVLVAGDPRDRREALLAAGVRGFVHPGSDTVSALTHWLDLLKVSA